MSSAFSRPTEASHGRCFAVTERVELRGKRKEGINLAEISLAHCEDGWRASHGFGFTSGDHWGSWSPVFASSTVHSSRVAAIASESDRLRDHIKNREGEEAERIRRWLDTLKPDLLDFIDAGRAA